jgi:hypothetical protein
MASTVSIAKEAHCGHCEEVVRHVVDEAEKAFGTSHEQKKDNLDRQIPCVFRKPNEDTPANTMDFPETYHRDKLSPEHVASKPLGKLDKKATNAPGSKSFSEVKNEKRFGMVMMGAGQPLTEWAPGIGKFLIDEKIVSLTNPDEVFAEAYTINDNVKGPGGRTDLVLIFSDSAKSEVGKLAMWRLQFGGLSWIDDFCDNYAGDFKSGAEIREDEKTKSGVAQAPAEYPEWQEYFDYLTDLRESGDTNMFGAGQYLVEQFGIDKKLARQVLTEWMKGFGSSANRKEIGLGKKAYDTEIMEDRLKLEIVELDRQGVVDPREIAKTLIIENPIGTDLGDYINNVIGNEFDLGHHVEEVLEPVEEEDVEKEMGVEEETGGLTASKLSKLDKKAGPAYKDMTPAQKKEVERIKLKLEKDPKIENAWAVAVSTVQKKIEKGQPAHKKKQAEVHALPIVELRGAKWFVDGRLGEIRQVDNPFIRIDFEADEEHGGLSEVEWELIPAEELVRNPKYAAKIQYVSEDGTQVLPPDPAAPPVTDPSKAPEVVIKDGKNYKKQIIEASEDPDKRNLDRDIKLEQDAIDMYTGQSAEARPHVKELLDHVIDEEEHHIEEFEKQLGNVNKPLGKEDLREKS